ncbi:hypothetical protein [Paenibacillus wynnii]|uniref:Uncharacterized protein n=1 Tax=Paenibacillus wynnii TaxID=268407 RepID=A0A098M8S6_9BACL|nr:hypothetical protein [Paenibacillus wynnii]KGE18453.1 hypothetical protein PWYN_28595 [Paenibacillus wynnii]
MIQLWHLFLQEIPYARAQLNLRDHIAISRFAPRIADVIREDRLQPQSVYDIQRLENQMDMLELEEYHLTENAKPMPDYVREQLQATFSKLKVNPDES